MSPKFYTHYISRMEAIDVFKIDELWWIIEDKDGNGTPSSSISSNLGTNSCSEIYKKLYKDAKGEGAVLYRNNRKPAVKAKKSELVKECADDIVLNCNEKKAAVKPQLFNECADGMILDFNEENAAVNPGPSIAGGSKIQEDPIAIDPALFGPLPVFVSEQLLDIDLPDIDFPDIDFPFVADPEVLAFLKNLPEYN